MFASFGVFWRPGASWRDKRYALISITATIYFMSLTTFVTYQALFVIMPVVFQKNRDAVTYHSIVSLYLFLNILGNFVNAHCVDQSVEGLPRDVIKSGRRRWDMWCKMCQERSPRRAHHCVLCDKCVLKRDHHCFFINTCVGFSNQKFFVMFCLYTFVAGLYCTVLQALYLNTVYGIPFHGVTTFLQLIPDTLYRWLWLADIAHHQAFLVIIFYSSFFSSLLSGSFFFWSMYTIYRGQTSFEARVGIDSYSKTARENLLDAFGPYWPLSVLLPLPLPQNGLGLYQDQYEDEDDDSSDSSSNNNTRVNGRRRSRGSSESDSGHRQNGSNGHRRTGSGGRIVRSPSFTKLTENGSRTPSPQMRRITSQTLNRLRRLVERK